MRSLKAMWQCWLATTGLAILCLGSTPSGATAEEPQPAASAQSVVIQDGSREPGLPAEVAAAGETQGSEEGLAQPSALGKIEERLEMLSRERRGPVPAEVAHSGDRAVPVPGTDPEGTAQQSTLDSTVRMDLPQSAPARSGGDRRVSLIDRIRELLDRLAAPAETNGNDEGREPPSALRKIRERLEAYTQQRRGPGSSASFSFSPGRVAPRAEGTYAPRTYSAPAGLPAASYGATRANPTEVRKMQIRGAIELLLQASLPEEAERVERRLNAMEREGMQVAPQPGRVVYVARPDPAVAELRAQVRELRREMQDLREVVRKAAADR